MGKGEIISEIGDGQYSVKLLYEGRDRLVASLALLDTKITDLETRISDLEDQIAELSLPDDADEIARLTFKLNVAKLQLTAIQKRKDYLEDNFPDDPIQNAWCIDLTTGLAGIVAIAEINGEMDQVNIRPGFTDSAVYDANRDGQMMPPVGGSPEQVLVCWMIFPGWQKWKPTYRIGTILTGSINHDLHTCSVCLSAYSSQLNLNINQGVDWGDCPADVHSGWSQFCSDNPSHPTCINTTENNPLYITPGILDIIKTIQALVNSEHEYESDKSGKEIGDNWKIMGAGETGDCEDFALTKLDELISAGVPVGNLQIATGYTETGGYHAVLLIRTSNMGNLILDNRYETVMDQNSLSYRWHLYQKAGSDWRRYSVLLENVSIEYMSCHSWAFEDGDTVIVEFENQDFSQPKVIGFVENPNHCGADFYEFGLSYIGHYVYSTESWLLHNGVGAYRDLATAMKGAKIGLDCYLTGGIERPLVPVWDVDHWIWDLEGISKQCLHYSIDNNTYALKADMLRRKLDHTSFAVNGKVFVAGGLRYRAVGYGGVDDFDKYDPVLNSWTIDSLPAGRSLSESFSISGYGYILMGFDSTPWPETGPRPFIFTFLKYNPLTEALSGLSNTDHSRWGHSAMVLDDMGYVIGGQASEKLLESDPECGVESCQTRDVSKYNPVTQSWLSTTQYPMHPNGGTYTTFYAGAGEKSSGYQSSRHNPGVTSYAFHRISSKTDSWQSLDVDYEALNMAYYNVASLAN